ncbi:CHAD domain-containing protein [Siccirubricoccus sp. G192]|nr:CHAD domain-containing protein [Siccirubricoccus sp. G192]
MAEELIWLDDAAGGLAKAGLALEAPQRGPRRLMHTRPAEGLPWLPGTPATPAKDAVAEDAATAPLVPVAAFTGRRSLISLTSAAGPVQAELLAGKLRAVAAERPAARLRLAGPPDSVLALAGRLAADLPLLPPRAALAEEGRALARGKPPRARASGPPDLAGAEAGTVEVALLTAIGHLLEVMLHHAPGCRLGAGPEGVHQTRVALRRLRSVLKAFRPVARCPALEGFDAGLKAVAQRLGPARDWDVFLAGLGAEVATAMPDERRIAALLKAAEARRQAAYLALRQELDGPGFRRLVLEGMALLLHRPWREATEEAGPERLAALDGPLPEFAGRLLDKRWHRLRDEGEDIVAHSAEALHEVRLTAKRLRYAAELFAPLWPGKPARRFLKRLAALQEDLGTANDTAVARALVASLGTAVPAWAVGAVEGFAVARADSARRHALSAWEDLMFAEPFWNGA